MSAGLYLAQRVTAAVLGLAVLVHLATVMIAVKGGLTAGEILGRTAGNVGFLLFYAIFVVAAAVHAPIGLRSVLREWTLWRGRSLDLAMLAFSAVILTLGLRAAYAVFSA
ncbi:succinate dehydrogenase [Chelatococcus sambhunathii]|uniref:succinate dehydrogenase n=1 Tax=Chelatococcus sambhunathii TaxID=363953 RepID=UPI0028526B83|nr:succinate dehydrogenase [Chelatococcus sambhunathii]